MRRIAFANENGECMRVVLPAIRDLGQGGDLERECWSAEPVEDANPIA